MLTQKAKDAVFEHIRRNYPVSMETIGKIIMTNQEDLPTVEELFSLLYRNPKISPCSYPKGHFIPEDPRDVIPCPPHLVKEKV